ncbi:MFS transporter [Paenibacillus turpanensis]|uniref:MFS transporter n=1 Tax=Paenibacillus turpanensis TaxID=2689078 RepID=UPI00140C6D60|nr:MFS transporter [Paenibacillus turpanensis]
MRTAVWLYLFIFIAFFDLHAQYPILTPFAVSLGAVPSFIGLIMGVYSITHLPGNMLAGIGVDRFGSKKFIVWSLIGAGILLLIQSQVTNPWQLLAVRSVSGFVLAFLSPACMSLLAKMARDRVHQGKLMAGNGLIHTLASVVSPAAGAMLVAKVGFTNAFLLLGLVLIGTAFIAIFWIRDIPASSIDKSLLVADGHALPDDSAAPANSGSARIPWLFYVVPLGISCSQGILFFELPLMESAQKSIMTSGILFSVVSLGSLVTLSMLFINRYSSYLRTMVGSCVLALAFFGMAIEWPIGITASLFIIGMAKGIIFPAMSTLLVTLTDISRYGRVFSILSISFSIGAFIGPLLAGHLRDYVSPYYIAFVVLMIALAMLPPTKNNMTSPVHQG